MEIGSTLLHYSLENRLGQGGMGTVYRARDTRLDRAVAVKVLPVDWARRPESRQRFEREARAISALNHPNVCTLHDVGQHDGRDYLVLELIEGETLASRLKRGPLPLDQAVRCGAEIAAALHKAHQLGIVHRDLKPGNVMLTRAGVKLLDFGLAKLRDLGTSVPDGPPLTQTPTAEKPLTSEGALLGTFPYMAPEQVEGRPADARSDIWALGALLYEMVTGRRAFQGTTHASVASSILRDEPPPLASLQPTSPLALERVVRACLAKDPDDRWQSAADAARELRWVAEGPATGGPSPPRTARWERAAFVVAAAVLAAAGLLVGRIRERAGAARPAMHSFLVPPQKTSFYLVGDDAAPVALSPNGAFAAFGAGGRLVVQSLRDGASVTLPSTDDARQPFWSPDSRFVGFFAEGKLKTVEAAGGPVSTLCDAVNPRGGTWGRDGVIVLAPDIRLGLFRASASGGAPAPLTRVDGRQHTTHRWPSFLPDGRHFVYLATNHAAPRGEESGIYLASVDGGEPRRLFSSYSSAQYVPPGYLLFVRGTRLTAQPFDASSFVVSGEPLRVADDVNNDDGTWRGVFSASANGLLAYEKAEGGLGGELTWFDRAGRSVQKLVEKSEGYVPRLSPDGRRLAFLLGDPSNDVWVQDLGRGVRTRVTTNGGVTVSPVWSPDGTEILYVTQDLRGGQARFVMSIAPASGAPGSRTVYETQDRLEPTDWSRDGRFVLCDKGNVGSTNLWVVPLADAERASALLDSHFVERNGQFSPTGRWMLYTSRETGRSEVYVASFPEKGVRLQVSGAGGTQPRWSRDGREIFFVSADRQMMAAAVDGSGPRFVVKETRPLFPVNIFLGPRTTLIGYDVGPDGQRFLINSAGDASEPRVVLVSNWESELTK
jgi:eukaryotic-like serine/threonine-protein kinase